MELKNLIAATHVSKTGTFFYLATPYTKYPWGHEQAFRDATRLAAVLTKDCGLPVFCPIAHSHPMAAEGKLHATDAEFWKSVDMPFINAASALIVATLPGWYESEGVKHEIAEFNKAGKPVHFLDIDADDAGLVLALTHFREDTGLVFDDDDTRFGEFVFLPSEIADAALERVVPLGAQVARHTSPYADGIFEQGTWQNPYDRAKRAEEDVCEAGYRDAESPPPPVGERPTTESQVRKATPLASGVLDYFPLALEEVARVSKAGNDKHNPGQELHWSRHQSRDHPDCIMRHLKDRGKIDADGRRHSGYLAWRALALLQEEIEMSLVMAGVDPHDVCPPRATMLPEFEGPSFSEPSDTQWTEEEERLHMQMRDPQRAGNIQDEDEPNARDDNVAYVAYEADDGSYFMLFIDDEGRDV